MARDSIPQPDVAVQDDKGNIAAPWYDALLATRNRGVSNTLGLETVNNALAGKQPLNANLSAIATLIGSGFLRRDENGTWTLSGLTPDDIPSPFATYLVDENGDYLVDEDGNFLVSDDGDPVPLENGGTGAALVDPNADRMLFWDDSAGLTSFLAPGNSVAITGTTLDTVQDIRTTASPQFTGLRIVEGSNAKQGAAVLVAGTLVVANTSITANSRIQLTSNVPGGTPGWLRVSARTVGTNFTILSSSATDTSTVAYFITEP